MSSAICNRKASSEDLKSQVRSEQILLHLLPACTQPPVISEAPTSFSPFCTLCQLLHVLFPQVTGAVNICTVLDKEKANTVPLFISLGTRSLGSSIGCFFFASPRLLERGHNQANKFLSFHLQFMPIHFCCSCWGMARKVSVRVCGGGVCVCSRV